MVQLCVPSWIVSSTAWIVTVKPVLQLVPSSTASAGDGTHSVVSLEPMSMKTGLVGASDRVNVNVVEPEGSLIVGEAGGLAKIEPALAGLGAARITTKAT